MCKKEKVAVNPHYTDSEIACIDAIKASSGHQGFLAFCVSEAQKKLWGAPQIKDPEMLRTRLQSAKWYLDHALMDLDWEAELGNLAGKPHECCQCQCQEDITILEDVQPETKSNKGKKAMKPEKSEKQEEVKTHKVSSYGLHR